MKSKHKLSNNLENGGTSSIFKVFMLLSTVLLLLTSCDSNKDKAEALSKQFIEAVNGNDKSTIFDLYPKAQKMKNLFIVKEITAGEIVVEKNEETGYYTATLDNQKKQKLVFETDNVNNLSIINSYGVLQLDSINYELALKTGVPLKKLSDIELGQLFREENFLYYLQNLYSEAANGYIYVDTQGRYGWGRRYGNSYAEMLITVTNYGETFMPGDDYSLEVEAYRKSTGEKLGTKTRFGQDLVAHETTTLNVPCDEFYNAAVNYDLSWNTMIHIRNYTKSQLLLKYAPLKGTEYEDYIMAEKNARKQARRTFELINQLDSKKLDENEISKFNSTNLQILRNAIYAKHGYIFTDTYFSELFGDFPWYKGETTDQEKVYSQFNDTEKTNLKIIMSYERKQ